MNFNKGTIDRSRIRVKRKDYFFLRHPRMSNTGKPLPSLSLEGSGEGNWAELQSCGRVVTSQECGEGEEATPAGTQPGKKVHGGGRRGPWCFPLANPIRSQRERKQEWCSPCKSASMAQNRQENIENRSPGANGEWPAQGVSFHAASAILLPAGHHSVNSLTV